jgi:hypothetical protein
MVSCERGDEGVGRGEQALKGSVEVGRSVKAAPGRGIEHTAVA